MSSNCSEFNSIINKYTVVGGVLAVIKDILKLSFLPYHCLYTQKIHWKDLPSHGKETFHRKTQLLKNTKCSYHKTELQLHAKHGKNNQAITC